MEQDIYVVVHIQVAPESRDEFLRIMEDLVAAARREHGNKRYELTRDLADPMAFTVIAIWASAEDIHLHDNSPEVNKLFPLLVSGAVKVNPMRGTLVL
ncbi:MAG: antibiotic biosynthesis monooxygenase [Desulfovibrio sp.]|jgi:quinol monooxygenase YgiN|nr:antibiotic biosynthesis monooxygenase [Desulfovibrio sp.]